MEDAEDLQAQQTAIMQLIKMRGTEVLKTPSLAKSIMADLTRNKQKGAVPAFYTMLDEMNSGKSFSDEKAAKKFLSMIEKACRENGLEIPHEIIVAKEKIKIIVPEDDTTQRTETQNDTEETQAENHSTENQFNKKRFIFMAIGVAIVFISWSISLLIFSGFMNMYQTSNSSLLVTLIVCYLYIIICMIINKYNFKSGVLISLGTVLALPAVFLEDFNTSIDFLRSFIIFISFFTLSLLLIIFITTIIISIASKIAMRKNKTANSIVITTTQQKSSDEKKVDNKMICLVIGAVVSTVLLCHIFVIRPFNITSRLGYVEKVDEAKSLLDAGADINAKIDYAGSTALMLAAGDGRTDIVKLLIDAGADINARNARGSTALIEALYDPYRYGRVPDIALIQLLINAEADINARDNYGRTALMAALKQQVSYDKVPDIALVQLLIKAGTDVNARDNEDGKTALIFASMNNSTEVVKLLIDAGADVNVRDNYGYTALIEALEHPSIYDKVPDIALVQLLIKARSDVNARTNNGKTALSIAENKGHTQIAQMLRNAGATR